jgi:glycosyltransferase involved in cell wall biosynthesis
MDSATDFQLVMIDDGSEYPINFSTTLPNFEHRRTHNKTPWSEHIARNLGAKVANGEYLFLIDIDYVIPEETIEKVLAFTGDRMDICRQAGILDDQGNLRTDDETLLSYGLKRRWLRGKCIPGHRSQYVMKKEIFEEIGGYREDLAGKAHPQGGGPGQVFNNQWRKLLLSGKRKLAEDRADVYMFPVGKFAIKEDPRELFHNLSR